MSEPTPGPWEASPQYGGLDYEVYSADPWKLADVLESADGQFSGEANARLISAAPDLLEAAKDAYSSLSAEDVTVRDEGLYDRLRTAIEKAEVTA